MLTEFLKWMNNPGYAEEFVVLFIFVLFFSIIVIFLLKYDIKSISKNGLNLEIKEDKKQKINEIKKDDNKTNNIDSNSKDRLLLNLMIENYFDNVIGGEIESFCKKGIINEKSEEEFSYFLEERKKEFLKNFNYYNKIIVDSGKILSDEIMTKINIVLNEKRDEGLYILDKCYSSIRRIAKEYIRNTNIKTEKNEEKFRSRLTVYFKNKENNNELILSLDEIIEDYKTEIERILIELNVEMIKEQISSIRTNITSLKSLYVPEITSIIMNKE